MTHVSWMVAAMCGVYIVGAVAAGGYVYEDTHGDEAVTFIVAFFWPFVLVILLLAFPFKAGAALAKRRWRL